MSNLGIIIDDNPISRCYINLLIKYGINVNCVIYLLPKTNFFKKIFTFKNFYKNNYYPLKFLKDKKLQKTISSIEKFFGYDEGFCREMYKFENLYKISNNITYPNDNLINSSRIFDFLKTQKKKIYLNTGKQILKEILNTGHDFIHIHPGYLPKVKGADGTLWHIKNFNYIGVSSFFISSKIDGGKIISREKFSIPNFEINDFKNKDVRTLYRFWYSFFDPLLRGTQLQKLLKIKFDFNQIKNIDISNEKSSYFSFMDEKEKIEIFRKVFSDNYK